MAAGRGTGLFGCESVLTTLVTSSQRCRVAEKQGCVLLAAE